MEQKESINYGSRELQIVEFDLLCALILWEEFINFRARERGREQQHVHVHGSFNSYGHYIIVICTLFSQSREEKLSCFIICLNVCVIL